MKIQTILYVLICFTVLSCKNSQQEKNKILINFFTAFSGFYDCEIDLENSTLNIINEERYYSIKKTFFSSKNKVQLDSFKQRYNKTFNIKKGDLTHFVSIVNENKFSNLRISGKNGLDGAGFSFTKYSKTGEEIIMSVTNPKRNPNFKLEFNLLDAFFELTYKSILNHQDSIVVENIQDYFDNGLAIKKVKDDPIQYRVFGSISGNRISNKKIIEFFKSLPANENIIIDVRNNGFSRALRSVLLEYSMKKKIYYYGSEELMDYTNNLDKAIEQENEYIDFHCYKKKKYDELNKRLLILQKFKKSNKKVFFKDKKTLLKTIAKI